MRDALHPILLINLCSRRHPQSSRGERGLSISYCSLPEMCIMTSPVKAIIFLDIFDHASKEKTDAVHNKPTEGCYYALRLSWMLQHDPLFYGKANSLNISSTT
ncbi:lipoma hmgic fusion partner-like 3 protein [Plakobranchus ocellatus]|uniref:Lipoma hmgic fusion partner-like 3 protein n=1 Tax=Plakobranchus ocellatus TaxID=259542 RepID=A0AAV4DJI6_9GAST|nr:lipoma hmgic fusion partner-like 3 protein [Plakobranchus ocellatus]